MTRKPSHCMVELTVCFETSYEAAITRKEDRYHDLMAETRKAGYTSTLITVEMGSRGLQTCLDSRDSVMSSNYAAQNSTNCY